ncbi:MAG: hypothetical protein IK032_06285 [Bacteroidales bacterium]|nr:hypothetical protein [Bacteroidales bacterium]MBR5028903.1 hypothetical protein [Bacteroidales bacterium]
MGFGNIIVFRLVCRRFRLGLGISELFFIRILISRFDRESTTWAQCCTLSQLATAFGAYKFF